MNLGSCLCGAVRYRVEGELAPIQVCHCSQCRKAQGAPFATNIPVSEADFHLLQGAESLTAFESSPGKQRVFCSRCGSPVFSRNAKTPGVVRLRAGSLDGELETRPAVHFHVASKANWWALNDGLPQFPADYPPKA
ncbi:GFA family protein [Pseudomonas sp. LS44]|uniref:GFA family protein n=1 Tax=Pseudomonas sp. LS44 TaxID=1357074 RepID=UPI00215A7B96|nr:GFA family protein [Pseudomonas sp. LS44]UVE16305.1 GFA family protein [Pseudomonas sp. LS44]